jgi:hypothetical protein
MSLGKFLSSGNFPKLIAVNPFTGEPWDFAD